jgi:hypothetical protein
LQKDSNPTQARHRIKVKTNNALKDLILLSNQTPSHLLEEFLPMASVVALVNSLLHIGTGTGGENTLDSKKSELAAVLAEKALMTCMWQHRILFRETPALGEPILTHLRNSISICRDLAYKIELIEQDKIALDENMMFLFKWSKLTQRGSGRLGAYMAKEMEIPVGDIFIGETDDKSIHIGISIPGDEEPTLDAFITLRSKDKAELRVGSGKNAMMSILEIKEMNGDRYVFGRKLIRKQPNTKRMS